MKKFAILIYISRQNLVYKRICSCSAGPLSRVPCSSIFSMAGVQCYLLEASFAPIVSLSKALPSCAPVTGVHLLITDDSAISYKCIAFEVFLGMFTYLHVSVDLSGPACVAGKEKYQPNRFRDFHQVHCGRRRLRPQAPESRRIFKGLLQ